MSSNKSVVLSKALPELAKDIDEILRRQLGERAGFALLVFPFNELGRASYISNGSREEMIKSIEQWLAQAKQDEQTPMAHETH